MSPCTQKLSAYRNKQVGKYVYSSNASWRNGDANKDVGQSLSHCSQRRPLRISEMEVRCSVIKFLVMSRRELSGDGRTE